MNSIALLASAALATPSTDVIASRTIDAAPEAVRAELATLDDVVGLMPRSCVGLVQRGETPWMRHEMAGMRRWLPVEVTRDEPELLELDHPHRKGFVTQLRSRPGPDGGTVVELTTYVEGPPRPFVRYYHQRVRPAWAGCWARTLERLELVVAAEAP